jgi:hypothetical protein
LFLLLLQGYSMLLKPEKLIAAAAAAAAGLQPAAEA